MFGTFACPDTCGFAKVGSLHIEEEVKKSEKERGLPAKGRKNQLRSKQEQHKAFNSYFNKDKKFEISFAKYHSNVKKFNATIRRWSFRKSAEKTKYLETFSLAQWKSLSQKRKDEHSLVDCRGCAVRYAAIKAFFPIKSRYLQGKAIKYSPVLQAKNQGSKLTQVKAKEKDVKSSAQAIYESISTPFQITYGTSFNEALAGVPETNLELSSKEEKRKRRREQYKKAKENIEEQMKDTAFLR